MGDCPFKMWLTHAANLLTVTLGKFDMIYTKNQRLCPKSIGNKSQSVTNVKGK